VNNPYDPPRVWIASTHRAVAAALSKWIYLSGGQQIPHVLTDAQILTVRSSEDIHLALDSQDKQTLLNSVFILDQTAEGFDAGFTLGASVNQAVNPADLILRYPEVYWLFIVSKAPDFSTENGPLAHGIRPELLAWHFVPVNQLSQLNIALDRHAAGFRVLLDPTGLRSWVMARNVAEHATVPIMEHGLSIEDDLNYALLNGYILYQRGCGVFLVTTLREYSNTKSLSNYPSLAQEKWHVIEDAELSFSDGEEAELQRESLLPAPSISQEDVLLSRGKSNAIIHAAVSRAILSTVHLDPKKIEFPSGQRLTVSVKPHRGLYDECLRLEGRDRTSNASPAKQRLSRCLEWFAANFSYICVVRNWLSRITQTSVERGSQSHSAPGAAQAVAAHLLQRCMRGTDTVATPQDAIQLAVLADVAYRLLARKTPYLSLEALGLRHRMEVEAECRFIGTSNALEVKRRLDDLEWEVREVIGGDTNPASSESWKNNQQRCNALLEICADVRDVFQSHDQPNEEDILLAATRKWQRRSYINGRNDWTASKFGLPWLRCFLRSQASYFWGYLNFILSSWGKLAFASAVWILCFGFLYWGLATMEIDAKTDAGVYLEHLSLTRFDWTLQSAATFVGLQQSLSGAMGSDKMIGEIIRTCAVTHPPIQHEDSIDSANADESRKQTAIAKQKAETKLRRLRPRLRLWWGLYVLEMVGGYIHAAALIYLLLSKFGRK